jgi:peptide chain release factor 1
MAVSVSDKLLAKLDELDDRYEALTAQLAEQAIAADHSRVRALSIKRAALEPIVTDYRAYRGLQEQIEEMVSVLDDGDPELAELARAELPELRRRAEALIGSVQTQLVRCDDESVGAVILEVRAGVGGDEAAIWAGDLVNMYRRFADENRWRVEEIELSPSEQGGFKQCILSIRGEGVWAQLGYEGGTHQVKRVPVTEAQGRIHTSTATAAVLPEPEEVEINLDPRDVKEMITTAQGPGGQNVNKVATAVHLIHQPTGLDVRIQDTKSQAQNREKAWQLLRARLYERQRAEQDAERAEHRNRMIGSGSRAEKIRTYRYKENIVVDHRLGSAAGTFNLTDVLAGRMQPLIDALIEQDTAQRLAAL